MANILNVYDTVYGNTKEVASIIEESLEKKKHTIITADAESVPMHLARGADLIFIGSPTHYWRPTKKILKFIENVFRSGIRMKNIVVYDTRMEKALSGGAGKKIAAMLLNLRFKIIGNPEPFYIDSTKGPLKLGEMRKGERLAEKADSFLVESKIESIMDKKEFVLGG
jgi:flavodoxin